jgi:DNA repair exonuclease SbcCD ATPase subunit
MFGPETNTQTFADLPFSKALALLSVPESEREEFAKEVDAEHISVQNLKKAIKEREAQVEALKKDIEGERNRGDDAIRAKEQAEGLLKSQDQQLAEAKAQIAELDKLNKELENRPHEVAVETVRDEEAIAAAAKEAKEAAEAASKKKIAALEKQLNKAENERAEALKKAETAGQDTEKQLKAAAAEAEKIRAELEEARKQLKASAADVTKFGVWFTTVQQDFLKMIAALREVRERDEETGKKLKTGAVALLNDLLERLNQEKES